MLSAASSTRRRSIRRPGNSVVIVATILLFWAVQTWDVWDVQDRYPAEAVPVLAKTPA